MLSPCTVCGLLDNDFTDKDCNYCSFCDAWICKADFGDLVRRAVAMYKRKKNKLYKNFEKLRHLKFMGYDDDGFGEVLETTFGGALLSVVSGGGGGGPIALIGTWQHLYTGTHIVLPAGSSGDWGVMVCSGTSTMASSTASDPTNGSWTALTMVTDATSATWLRVYHKTNIASAGVTVTLATTPTDCGCSGGRFSNVSISSPIRQQVNTDFTGVASTTYTTGSSISPSAGDLILMLWANENGGISIGPTSAGYTLGNVDDSHTDVNFYKTAAVAGSQTPSWVDSSAVTNWVMTTLDVAIGP
jgi:hypothetical protein